MRQKKGTAPLPTELLIPLGVLSLAFGLGGLVGVLFAASIEGEGGQVLAQYLTTYFQLVAEGVAPTSFFAILWEQSKLPLCGLMLGFSALGIIGIPLAFGVRGFFLSYSVSCLWRIFGADGLLAAGFLFGLTALISVPALFVLGVQGLNASVALLRRSVGVGRVPLPYGGGYALRCGGCVIAIGVAVVVEWAVVPILLQSVAGLLG